MASTWRAARAPYLSAIQDWPIGTALQAGFGRCLHLILPLGLEKRVLRDLVDLAIRLNKLWAHGPCWLPVPGVMFTEIGAIKLLVGAEAVLVEGSDVCGAESSVWLALSVS